MAVDTSADGARPKPSTEPLARRLWRLLEPVHLVTYFAAEPTAALKGLGLPTYWAAYFAGRSAPLGRVPAEVVDALFYTFGPGQAGRSLPAAWDVTTPAAVLAARETGSVTALRRLLGEAVDGPGVGRAADLALRAAVDAPTEGRPLYAALTSVPVPQEPVARLWHAATLLREHRGDGHLAALLCAGIGGMESHVLQAVARGLPPAQHLRLQRLPADRVEALVDGLRARGLVVDATALTDAGTRILDRIETTTDELAAPAFAALTPQEADELVADLEPLVARIRAVGY